MLPRICLKTEPTNLKSEPTLQSPKSLQKYSFTKSLPFFIAANINTYQISDPSLPYLHAAGVESLQTTGERLHRQRRAPSAPPATPDAKSQYQSINAGNATTADTTVTTVDSGKSSDGSVSYNVHNVGVNGTGQRKDYTVQNADGSSAIGTGTSINVAAKKPTQLLASPSGYPKKVGASAASAGGGVTTTTTTSTTASPTVSPGIDVDDVDVSEDEIEKNVKNESLQQTTDNHEYYNSTIYVSKAEAASLWDQLKNISVNSMLSSSHRRAMTVELKFDFPFYGHNVRNITVATGGFLYTGEYVHSWLAATQYIAPLMANFDTSISNDSFVRMHDNGESFKDQVICFQKTKGNYVFKCIPTKVASGQWPANDRSSSVAFQPETLLCLLLISRNFFHGPLGECHPAGQSGLRQVYV